MEVRPLWPHLLAADPSPSVPIAWGTHRPENLELLCDTVWVYLSAELTLKLHGAQSYQAFPRITALRWLIEALGPELAARHRTRKLVM
jgi:hypothetical protein